MTETNLNRLAKEKSPYLLQHAGNPVDWYPWGEEAFKKAKNDGKPIFLSIGYSSCHWCHVMERESFEDPALAEFINKNFIPVKVDREERPEVDNYYMSAVQTMTGQGGWPLTVFLTPGLNAFFGGTYFPPEPKYGMPSFMQVLEFVSKLWKNSRGEVTANAERIAGAVREMQPGEAGKELSRTLLDDAYTALAASFDTEHGGFGGSPKFPLPLYLEFMLRYHFRTGRELALTTVSKTLDAMASGGIHDILGGGFHRYATDKIWLVPHFEKMLYDNALLATSYIHAYKAAGNPRFAEVAKDTLGWVLAELESPEGGFYSAQDADTEEGEGVYYTWAPDEIDSVLGEKEAEVFRFAFGVTKNGNFEGGRTILRQANSIEGTASKFETTPAKLKERLDRSRATLYKARLARPRPATDTKILTSWNGLVISALARASGTFAGPLYKNAALKAAKFILTKNVKGGELMRRYADGEAAIPATLEDYAFLGLGLLDLFEETSQPKWLEETIKLSEQIADLFEDRSGGGFFGSVSQMPARMIETYDGPMPSGNSAAIMLFLRLSTITGTDKFRESAAKALRRFQSQMDWEPTAHTFMLLGADTLLNGGREVVLSGRTAEEMEPFVEKLRGKYLPDLASFTLTRENQQDLVKLTPLAEGRPPGSKPLAYVCQNFACKLPAKTPEEFERQLGTTRS